jgi:hypothetical protein
MLNHKISTRKTNKSSSKVVPNNEKNNKVEEEKQSQKKRLLPNSIIYDPGKNQKKDIQTAININDDNNSSKQDQEKHIVRNAKEIANYSLDLHKDIINTYNSVYSQLLQNIFNYSNNDITILKRFMDYPFDNKNMYTNSISNNLSYSDESLKLIDNVMTKNMDTFIKSIELTQRFYKDIVQSYLNYIKKSKINQQQ